MLHQQITDDHPQLGGPQSVIYTLHVAPALDGADDGSVGGGPADTIFLQGADQSRLTVAGRRLGEVLLRDELDEIHLLPFHQRWQDALPLSQLLIVPEQHQPARELDGGTGGAEEVGLLAPRWPGQHVNGGGVQHGRRHLAGHKAPPDEAIEPMLIGGQIGLHPGRCAPYGGGADRLVGLLSALGFGLVVRWLGGQEVFAVCAPDVVTGLLLGGLGHIGGVGAHVGDETHSLAIQFDPLVELLGDTHGAARIEAQSAGGLALHGAGDEGRPGMTTPFPLPHLSHNVGCCFELLDDSLRVGLVLEVHFLVTDALQLSSEFALLQRHLPVALGQVCLNRPVLHGHEGLDLPFALHYQSQRD